MAKVKGKVISLKGINPMDMVIPIIKGEAVPSSVEEALQFRAIIKEAQRMYVDRLEAENKKLDSVITVEAVKNADPDKVVIDINNGDAKYSFSTAEVKKVTLAAEYARNEDLYKDHPELVEMKETVIYSLRKDIDTTIDGVVNVDKHDVIKESCKIKKA